MQGNNKQTSVYIKSIIEGGGDVNGTTARFTNVVRIETIIHHGILEKKKYVVQPPRTHHLEAVKRSVMEVVGEQAVPEGRPPGVGPRP